MNLQITRRSIFAGVALVGTFTSLANHAGAACYVEQFVPGTLACETTKSSSADFALGCDATPDSLVQVQVECPKFSRETDNTSGDYYDGVDKNDSAW